MAPNVFHVVLRHLSIKMIDYDPNFVAPANDMVNNPVIRVTNLWTPVPDVKNSSMTDIFQTYGNEYSVSPEKILPILYLDRLESPKSITDSNNIKTVCLFKPPTTWTLKLCN